jgi:hypothetical protein
MPGILDRARLELFIQRLDYHLSDLPRARRRLIRGELRANIQAAAAEVGVRQAVANLGRPSVLCCICWERPEQADCCHENPPPLPCTRRPLGVRRLLLPV